MKFCPECGTKLVPGAAFCSECGYRIAKDGKAGTAPERDPEDLWNGARAAMNEGDHNGALTALNDLARVVHLQMQRSSL